MRRGSSMKDESMRDRFIMRPSIARMTLDLDYADMEMDHSTMGGGRQSAGGKSVEALQTRLQELLVFEIRQDGDTQMKSLSVRGLYKYVLKAMKVSAEKRPTIRENSNTSLSRIGETSPTNDTSSDSKNVNASKNDTRKDEGDIGDDSTNSDSDNEKIKELVGGIQTTTRPSYAASTTSRVSFGGPEGPVITEHPPPPPRDSRASVTTNATTGDHPNHSGRVTYRERLGGFLHPRDMRRLVTPFSASNEPELIVRRHVILLNFDPLRAVILRDRLLVLVPDGADSLLQDIEKRVRGGTQEAERDIFGENTVTNSQAESSNIDDSLHSLSNVSLSVASENGKTDGAAHKNKLKSLNPNSLLKKAARKVVHPLEKSKGSPYASSDDLTADTQFDDIGSEFKEWEEMEGRDWIDLPFELQCLDAVLGSVATILANDTAELKSTFILAMNKLLHKGSSNGDEILRHMKNSIGEMTSRVKGFIRAMNLVLDETEDMALMNLSRLLTHPERFIQPVDEAILDEESDEPELILEAHLQNGFSLTNTLNLVRGEIETTQELINQRLDAVRNRLLLANMIVSICSLCVAFGSFVGSIFGMNVVNHIEDKPDAFTQIVLGTCLGMIGLVLLAGLILWYAGTMPNLRSSF